MKLESLYWFYQKLKEDNLCFIYQGDFSDNMTEKMISMSEGNLDHVKEMSKMKRKISFLMAESFQNVIRHGSEMAAANDNKGLFLARNIGNTFFINSANLILNDEIPGLEKKLNQINNLDKDQLKSYYLDVLSNTEISQKGGAGLGLIEMARKSSQKLEFDFEKIDEKISYFYLGIKLVGKQETEDYNVPIRIAKFFHREMMDDNIIVSYKGDFSQNSIMPVLRMVEDSIYRSTEKRTLRKRVFLTLVELSQNISLHALKKGERADGIVIVTKSQDVYTLSAGNLISNDKIEILKQHLEDLRGLTDLELKSMYKETLLNGPKYESAGAGLGLIEIFRDCQGEVLFDFTPVDHKKSFYSIKMSI
ncbi:MAG: SiaB family protein kinase [Flavobacteriales bacterium]|nr:SiaB family protein kinase [Flavobacteriales bacterium]